MSVNKYEVEVASIFLQGTLYGVFAVIFVLTYWALVLRRPPEHRLNKVMVGALGMLFILATIYIIIQVVQIFDRQGDGPKSNLWNRSSYPMYFACAIIYFAQTLVGHGVALYRCWVVCTRRLTPIVLPCLFFVGGIVSSLKHLVSLSKYKDPSSFVQQIWLITSFSFALALSTTCTLIIATRIWFLKKYNTLSSEASWTLYFTVITQIVLDSGAIYCSAMITLVVSLALDSWFQCILVDSMVSIIGLVFSIVIYRMRLDNATDELWFSNIDTLINSISSPKMNGTLPHHHQPISCVFRDSIVPSPSRFWPIQPDRSLPYGLPRTIHGRQHCRNIKTKTKTSRLGFSKHHDSPRLDGKKSHYNLRSKLVHPSSYFRTSEEMGIDMELEVEMDEAKLRKPKALPAVLI